VGVAERQPMRHIKTNNMPRTESARYEADASNKVRWVVAMCLITALCWLFFLDYSPISLAQEKKPDAEQSEGQPVPKPVPEKNAGNEHEELLSQGQKILALIDKLESKDEAERKVAFQTLKDIGLPVIPFLVDKLKEKGIYVELAAQIQAFRLPTPEEIKANLHVWQEMIGPVADKDLALIEKFFYSKYLEAIEFYKAEEYQFALDIVNAMLRLEPKITFQNKLKLFKIACEEKIIQKNVLRATLRTPKDIYEIGDKIFVTLKLENVSLAPVEIDLPPDPFMVINLNITEYGPFGDYLSDIRMEQEKLTAKDITLKPQEFWEYTFAIDTAKDGIKTINYRTYEVVLEIYPSLIKLEKAGRSGFPTAAGNASLRKIVSLPLLLRTFPPNIEKVQKEPLPSLTKALDAGIPIDIFLCALIVPESDKDKALELLIRGLDKSTDQAKKAIMTALKLVTKLPVELDEKAWLQWWQERGKKK